MVLKYRTVRLIFCLLTAEMYAQMRTVIESGSLNLFRLTENLAKYE